MGGREGGTVDGVPVVVAAVPRQPRCEGREQVVEGPCQDHVVVAVEEEDGHCRRPADACTRTVV